MADSKIEWTDAVWNPVTGCTRVSAGCDHCYAVGMTARLEAMGKNSMTNATQQKCLRDKYAGLTVMNKAGERQFNGKIRTHDDALEIPLRWKKPRRIFVNSMSDLFHRDVPFEFIDRVFAVMSLCPQHTFQVLTKRPERMAEYLFAWEMCDNHGRPIRERVARAIADLPSCRGHTPISPTIEWPLKNVWLGTSAENQEAADERIPHLLRCPAAVRFLSCEPLLGPIEFSDVSKRSDAVLQLGELSLSGIDWVIVGGESGSKARPMHPDWARSIRDQCAAAGVAFFYKQWGEWCETDLNPNKKARKHCFDDGKLMQRIGKKATGRLLDGVEHNEMPVTAGVI